MQTCFLCNTQSHDSAAICPACGADLAEHSTTSVALKKFQANPRVKNIPIVIAHDCCPACQSLEGTYDKYQTPRLPIEGCSRENGCRCFYKPMFNEIYP